MTGARGREKWRGDGPRVQIFSHARCSSYEDLLYINVTKINNMVLTMWNYLNGQIFTDLTTKQMGTMWGNGYSN